VELIENMNSLKIRNLLLDIRLEFNYYPDDLTPEIKKQFVNRTKPLIKELNKRLYNNWIKRGAKAVSKRPVKLTFASIMKNGL
jgi:hypothetical protein